MNKTAIKNFAIWARNKLIADIQYRAGLMGITPDGIKDSLPQSTGETEFYDIGTAEPYAIIGDEIRQRRSLVDVLNRKASESDYKTAYKYIIEGVAYTWFNRLIAIRFMEVNDYLPSHVRVLSSESGKTEPDLVTAPFDADLDFSDEEKEEIIRLKQDNKLDEVFRLLFIKQCNALNEILPALFEKTSDYTEVLLNVSAIDKEGVVYRLANDIPEEDFDVEQGGQVEVIGWLYQYYNTEPKDEAFAKKGKITKEEIPAVTQLFTPDWIVRYMVENSLGRLWVEGHPNDSLKENWKYYLEEAKQEPEVQEQLDEIHKEYSLLNPEDIHFIDPCMGSGHILVYAFDVLMQIYKSVGYSQRDAAKSILAHNLYGLDIDDRAYQMAYFAVMMKARQYNRRILSADMVCHVYSIQDSNIINRNQLTYFGVGLFDVEKKEALSQIEALLDTFKDAKEYGSILNVENYEWDLLRRFAENYGIQGQMTIDAVGIDDTKERLLEIIAIGETMARKYEVVVTNPPYMGNMPVKMTAFVQKYYKDSKYDLYAVFTEKNIGFAKNNAIIAMISQHSWMFISSFEQFRKKLMQVSYYSLLHLGTRAFEEIGGEVVQTVAFVLRKSYISNYKLFANRLVDYTDAEEKERAFLEQKNSYVIFQRYFELLPGNPIVYWLSDGFYEAFINNNCIGKYVDKKAGVVTGNDSYFLRLWFEPDFRDISLTGRSKNEYGKYHIMSKGGSARRYYGNYDFVIKLVDLYNPSKTNVSVRRGDQDYYFKKAIGWSQVGNAQKTFRTISNSVCGTATPTIYIKDDNLFNYILGFLNCKIAFEYLTAYNPTINLLTTDICNLPLIIDENAISTISDVVDNSIESYRMEWNAFETSWDFKRHPLVPSADELGENKEIVK